jgi:hypothetical protein
MPRYRKSKNHKLVRKRRKFTKPYQLIHFLSTANEESFKPFRDKANEYLSGEDVPPIRLKTKALQQIATEHPKQLVAHAVSDFNTNDAKGGGLSSGVAVIYDQISHLLGMDKLKDAVFGVDKKKQQSLESQFAAYLVQNTYKDINDRPDKVLNRFKRVPKYDTSHISVWEDIQTGEYTVSVSGTRAKTQDILEDIGILVGNINPNSSELDGVLDKLEADSNTKYNIACHSLGAMFVNKEETEHGSNWDHVWIFNPGSSPMQPDKYEQDMANNEKYDYYMNHGDPISGNLLHHMSHDTIQNQTTFGDYQYSPIASHSISNWFPEQFSSQDDKPLRYDKQPTTFDTAEFQIDNAETQAANLS